MEQMQFFLPMKPPTTTHQAKQIHAYMKGGKPHAVLHQSPELRATEAKLHAALAPHRPAQPMQGAVQLVVKWCFYADGKHPDGTYKTTKPDTDNLQKALKDQMTKLGYWKDDAQVASEIIEKFWADIPGVFIQLREVI
jgi:Holliday junction resolvase RusA-like endonuclease